MPESHPKPNGADASAQALTRERLLSTFRASPGAPLWATLARIAFRAALRAMKTPMPDPKAIGTANVEALCDAVLAAAVASKTSATELEEILGDERAHFAQSIACIRVDMALRGTVASDMPAEHRLVLRTLAGHAEKYQCWPSKETVAGECGLCVRTVDRAISALIFLGWLRSKPRFAPDGKTQLANTYTISVECGRWWGPETLAELADRKKKKREPKKVRGHPMHRGDVRHDPRGCMR